MHHYENKEDDKQQFFKETLDCFVSQEVYVGQDWYLKCCQCLSWSFPTKNFEGTIFLGGEPSGVTAKDGFEKTGLQEQIADGKAISSAEEGFQEIT